MHVKHHASRVTHSTSITTRSHATHRTSRVTLPQVMRPEHARHKKGLLFIFNKVQLPPAAAARCSPHTRPANPMHSHAASILL